MNGADQAALTVRPIAPGDVARVWEMLRDLAEHDDLMDWVSGDADMLRDALFGTGDRIRGLVAERANRIIGYALYYPVFGSFRARWRLWLEDLYVEPESRGGGAGIALLAALAREVAEGGYVALDWETLDQNRSAHGFYAHLGAHPIGEGWLRYRLDGVALEDLAGRDA